MFSLLVSNYYKRFPNRSFRIQDVPMPMWIIPWFFLWFSFAVKEQCWPNLLGMICGYIFAQIRNNSLSTQGFDIFTAPLWMSALCDRHFGAPEHIRIKRESQIEG
jgi:hypothetical protein